MRFALNYASPSAFESNKERALLGLAVDGTRRVRFRGKIKPEAVFLVRTVLRALGEVIWSADNLYYDGLYDILDPIITVHNDKIFFEAFSQDQSVQAMVALDRELFETEGEVICGTSNIDFTSWLWSALGEMRTSRTTWLHLEDSGLELATVGGGGRFEKKVDVPESWVRGFLQVQGAASLPGTRLTVKPVDFLSVVRFLRYSKARTSPRGIRYEFEPGEPARVVLEPWEETFVFRECEHNYDKPKVTRLWGRRRLRLLEPVLPFTDSVDIYLKGRGMPSFYQLNLPGIQFSLGLSGWSGTRWTDNDGFGLLGPVKTPSDDEVAEGLSKLQEETVLEPGKVSSEVLSELCRRGLALYQLESRSFRHRELFAEPLDMEKVYPPSHMLEKARELLDSGRVKLTSCEPRETRKIKRLKSPEGKVLREVIHRDWHYVGDVGEQKDVEVVVSASEKIIFGRCGCPHFQEHLLSRGPCEHLLALRILGDQERVELPTSEAAQEEGP